MPHQPRTYATHYAYGIDSKADYYAPNYYCIGSIVAFENGPQYKHYLIVLYQRLLGFPQIKIYVRTVDFVINSFMKVGLIVPSAGISQYGGEAKEQSSNALILLQGGRYNLLETRFSSSAATGNKPSVWAR